MSRVHELERVVVKLLQASSAKTMRFPIAVKVAVRMYGVREATGIRYVEALRKHTCRLEMSSEGFSLK